MYNIQAIFVRVKNRKPFWCRHINIKICLVTGALSLFSFGSGADALRLSLGERGMVQHLKLLSESPLYGADKHLPSYTLRERFLLKDYASFIRGFDEAYPSPNLAQPEELYQAILSHYQLGNWTEVHRLLPFLDTGKLQGYQRSNIVLVQGVDAFKYGQYQALEKLSVGSDSVLVGELKDALYLKQSGAVKYSVREPYLSSLLARNNLVTGNYDEALAHFSRAGVVSTDAWVVYTRALKLLKSGQYELSQEAFESLPEVPEFRAEKAFRLLEIQFFLKNYNSVLERASQFRSLYGEATDYMPLLKLYEGLAAYQLGQLEWAIRLLSSVQEVFPIAAMVIGNIYDNQGLNLKAAERYQSVLRHAKAGSDLEQSAVHALAWSQYKQKNYSAAKDLFARLIRSADESIRLISLIKMGDAYFNLRSYKDAVREYTTALNSLESRKDVYPGLYAQMLFSLASVQSKLRQYEDSNVYLRAYISQTVDVSEQSRAERMMIENDLAMEKYDRVIELLEKLVLRNAEEQLIVLLADTYYNVKNYDKALSTYRLCLTTFPKGNLLLDAHYGAVQSLLALKRYDEALTGARQADELFGTHLELEMTKKIQLDREQKR